MKTIRRYFLGGILLVGLLAISGCGSTNNAAAETTPIAGTGLSGSPSDVIVEGRVVPRDFTTLSVNAAGKVAEVLVAEGANVTKGTVLLRMGDKETFQASVAAAKAEVTSAQQAMDALKRTATEAYYQATLDEAAAQKIYNTALKAWDDFNEDQYDKDLDQAKSDVATALSELKDAQDEFAKYQDRDKDNADRIRTKNALKNAQTKYDNALSRQTEIENKYKLVKSNLEIAHGKLAEATRIRKLRESGPDQDQLALLQNNLDAAQANLAAAQSALERMDLVAPYDGVVARIDISAGEEVVPAQPLIVFADLHHWYVETTDLTEKKVVNLKVGQQVTVIPDAWPQVQLIGTIEQIALTYTEKAGDIVYKVRIRLDPTDTMLFWGMTTEVHILAG
jgi:HlyD family secretion protein